MSSSVVNALMRYAASGGEDIMPVIRAVGREKRARAQLAQAMKPAPAAGPTTTSGGGSYAPPVQLPPGTGGPMPGAVRAAATQLGKPYVFGSGPDTSSFDCSDLVQWAYKQVGIAIPRDTYGQMRVLHRKSWSDLKPGDPIYRKNGGHVVLYAGGGRVLAAPHTGTVVQYQPLSYFQGGDYEPYQAPSRPK